MSQWNRAYLDAIGVPVWVPRQLPRHLTETSSSHATQVEEASVAYEIKHNPTEECAVIEKVVEQNKHYISRVIDQEKASYSLIVGESCDTELAKQAYQQLQYAWRAWQESEFPMSLYQLSAEGVGIGASPGTLVLAGLNLMETNAIKAPELTLDNPSNKRKWWQLLQQLAENH